MRRLCVSRAGGWRTQAFLREEFRETGKLGSRYDPNVTAYDPFPYKPTQETNDPILLSIMAPTTTAMVDFVTRTVGWKTDAGYHALSSEVERLWDQSSSNNAFVGSASATDLRVAVATDPKLRVGDRAWMGGSIVPVHGVVADRKPDSDHGRPDAGAGA